MHSHLPASFVDRRTGDSAFSGRVTVGISCHARFSNSNVVYLYAMTSNESAQHSGFDCTLGGGVLLKSFIFRHLHIRFQCQGKQGILSGRLLHSALWQTLGFDTWMQLNQDNSTVDGHKLEFFSLIRNDDTK